MFRYQDEVIDTGIAEIDDELVGDNASGYDDNEIWTGQGTTQSLLMVGTVNASAFSGIVDGGEEDLPSVIEGRICSYP